MSYFKRVWEEQKRALTISLIKLPKELYKETVISNVNSFKNFKTVFKLIPIISFIGLVCLIPIFTVITVYISLVLILLVIPIGNIKWNINLNPITQLSSSLFKKYIYNSDSK